MSQEVVRLSKLTALTVTGTTHDRPVREAAPPTSLALASTTSALPPSSTVSNNEEDSSCSNDQESSAGSDENFEVISNPVADEGPVAIDDNVDSQS